MKKMLICSYYYPPYIHPYSFIASLRISKFVKYLPSYGFETFILAAKDPWCKSMIPAKIDAPENVYHTSFFDPHFFIVNLFKNKTLNEVPSISIDNTSLKTAGKKNVWIIAKRIIRDMIVWPDSQISWMIFGNSINIASEIIENEGIDVIMSTSPPGTTHILANILAKKYGLPWLADFRDSWTANGEFERIGPLCRLDRLLEKKCLKRADALMAVSKPMVDNLSQVHNKPARVITNGFDEEDYDFSIELDQKFTITYTGRITAIRSLSLIILLKAISELIEEGHVDKKNLRIRIWGHNSRECLVNLAMKYGVQKCVESNMHVVYSEIIKYQKSSQILLSLEGMENRNGVYTGKIFEYLGAKRPILAIAEKDGVIDDLLRSTHAGVLCCDVDCVKMALLEWYSQWRENGRVGYHGSDKEIMKFSRRNTARQLSIILKNLIEENHD